MSLMAPVPRRIRVREAVLGLATLVPLPVLLALPRWMLEGIGPITAQSACPPMPGPAGCTPVYAERVTAVIDALGIAAPLLALASALVVLVLVARGRRAWVLGVVGAALTAAAVLVRIELAMVNAST